VPLNVTAERQTDLPRKAGLEAVIKPPFAAVLCRLSTIDIFGLASMSAPRPDVIISICSGGGVMVQLWHELRALEGQFVSVGLTDGSRMGDCMLVSVGRGRVGSLWLFDQGRDVFVPMTEVVAVWAKTPVREHLVA
jgi:hypothetical protein